MTLYRSFFALCCALALLSCKRHLSPAEVRNNLQETMRNYLINEQSGDTTHLRFLMEDVNYFEEKDFYLCEFTVHLYREGNTDTTGLVRAKISKDFSKVVKR